MITENEITLYKRITGRRSEIKPIAFIPIPTESDYKFGEIIRYFCQQSNNSSSEIIEIDKGLYEALKTNPLYNVVSVRWLISGQIKDTVNPETNVTTVIGVKSSNDASVRIASKTITNIRKKLNNPLQFYRVI